MLIEETGSQNHIFYYFYELLIALVTFEIKTKQQVIIRAIAFTSLYASD